MDNFGEYIGIILFILISIISAISERNKKKKETEKKAPKTSDKSKIQYQQKEKSPIEILEEKYSKVSLPAYNENINKQKNEFIENRRLNAKRDFKKTPTQSLLKTATATKNVSSKSNSINKQFLNPKSLRQLYLIHEILSKPKALNNDYNY